MKPEIKELWVKALLSGEYKQGTHELVNNKGEFCCLGVLCDLARKAGVVEVKQDQDQHGIDRLFYGNSREHAVKYTPLTDGTARYEVLPESVMDWAGLETNNPDLNIRNEEDWIDGSIYTVPMAELNDELVYSFRRIAKLIEQQL